ncbi:3'-5' exoribonuclease HELZ2-like isoform X2 [Littorina saxatilis]
MPKKKKAKNPQPIVRQAKDSSDSDVDSDSSNLSEDDHFVSNYTHVRQNPADGKSAGQRKTNVVQVTPTEPDLGSDILQQTMGFKKVGAAANKGQPNGMGLDDFSVVKGHGAAKSKSQTSQNASGPRLPPVNISWPLEDAWQFRLACRMCFVKTGEGYKAYNLNANLRHQCERDVCVIRRKGNESLNWIKIRPYPQMHNSRFADFKMCQQFANSLPCRIGEHRCTFPHNRQEMDLWYMERDGEFSVTHFIEELRKHGIDTSEQLEARKPTKRPEPQHIPGLNFKQTGTRQRLASPAPIAEPSPPPVMRPPPPVQASYVPKSVPPSLMSSPPPAAYNPFSAPPPGAGMPPRPLGKGALLGAPPPGYMTSPPPQSSMSRPPPPQPSYLQQAQHQPSPPLSMGAIDNTLKDYDYKVVCPECFPYDNFPGRYHYNPHTHICEENVLIVKQRFPNAPWQRVRERTNHRDFPGKYILCHSVLNGKPELCRYGEASCSFAHNEAEQRIWAMEKMGRFSITDFILQNRNTASTRGFTVNEVLKKYGGFFTFVCRSCFYGRPPCISEAGPNNACTNNVQRHRWDQSAVLAHVNTKTGEVTPIDHRKFTHKGAFFRICRFLHFCKDQATDKCLSAHSLLERDVWMLERDTGISREEIVQQCQRRQAQSSPEQQQQPQQQQQQQQQPQVAPMQGYGAAASRQTKPQPTSAPSSLAPAVQGANSGYTLREKVPHTVQEYCGMCWTNGTKSLQDGNSNRCLKGHGNFQVKRVFLIVGIFRELRSLPSTIPRNLNFVVCRFIQQKKKCQFVGPGPCQFAHSEEERVLWIWMARNKVNKVEDVVKACNEDLRKTKINQGDSVVAAQPMRVTTQTTQVRLPMHLQNNTHYCRYCSIQCNSERQWEEHTASEKHMFHVNSDKDHQWNYRQPPWGQGSNLSICSKHVDGGRCPYSHVPDMFNLCKYAHSQEELDEWRERYEWRSMKRALAKEQNMFSYMDQLLERYNAADSRVTEMSETLPGVQVKCQQPLEQFKQEKNAVIVWTFILRTQLNLERVALLHHSARLHFFLQCGDGTKHQIATGEQFEDVDEQGRPCYRVNVHFQGGMFGSFNQWVAFDFGKKPVLLRKMNVELGHETLHEKVRDLREKLTFDRWTPESRQVIPYKYKYDEFDLELFNRYKEPGSQAVVTQDSIRELNRHNYVHKMHKMLELEEITRHKLISSFDVVSTAQVTEEIITELQGTFRCRNGELFLRLPLTENLTEDTGAGKLILTSVRSALLTRTDQADKHRVYEAMIEAKGRDYVYLTLTPVCVRELKMQPGTSVEVEVQFQMDRLHFIRMHYALDCLTSTDIVFPDVTKINPLLNEQHTLKVSSKALNAEQLQAVKHIVAERTGYTPPFIMYGPFGTGKTETLAQAALVLLRERPEARILICAQSNSAADLYVTKHLDPYLRKTPNSQSLLLRIVTKERRINSIPESTRKYCCYSPDGNSFEVPPANVVQQHRVVVTTVEMSLYLTVMKLKGAFTHIFIDEAAQALECETVMPLSLATEKTCVVLTGDHMQISPKVYSGEARRQNFGMSMLERLYLYYFEFYHQLQERPRFNPLNIFLSINYRTKMEILRFISAVFYGGPDKLTAAANIPSVLEWTPLLYYAVQGREVQDKESTSFYNRAESSEVVERVIELLDDWPREWGAATPEEIGVVTPYHDQVKEIRYILKSKRRHDLRKVNVETVQNIQGKEFRALFISTVRTRNLLESEHVARALMEAESVGGVADFAFLSDSKLLNTALTRTKSLVAVVGDPVALCAIGECITIWRTYMKHCHNMRSIHPPNMNYDSIKTQVVHLQMSEMGRRLKEVTDLIKNPQSPSSSMRPQQQQQQQQPASSSYNTNVNNAGDYSAHKDIYIDDFSSSYSTAGSTTTTASTPAYTAPEPVKFNGHSSSPVPPAPLKPLSKVKVTKAMSEEDKAKDVSLVPDEILLQLAQESLGSSAQTEPLKVECVSVVEEIGQAVLTYDTGRADEDKRKKMLQAAAAGQEFDGDAEIYEDRDKDSSTVTKYYNYMEKTLDAALHNHPERFKRCSVSIKGDTCVAMVLDPLDPVQEIEIKGSLRRGRAFDKDKVVVEMLPAADNEEEERSEKSQGRVAGITQRAIDHRCRSFVCSADTSNTGLLVPINPGVPRVYNVVLRKHLQRVKKGFVCVYQLSADKTLAFSHYEKVEANDAEEKLFVVRYLKWLPGFFNPLGVVVGVIPAGHDLSSSLNIVDIEHHLPSQFSSQVMQEVASRFSSSTLPTEVYNSRINMTDTWCFTIGTPEACDLEVAFSIDQKSDTSYQVCVHISDVASFVEKDSALDKEALQRGSSILPIGRDPIHMLPERLSKDLCSLQTGSDRCALSVFITVAGGGEEWHVTETSVQRTVINSKHRFSHRDIDSILQDIQGAENDYLKSCVLVLFQIAHMRRKQRKGNAHLDPELTPVELAAMCGHYLVQELLIMANHQVAEQLLAAFPQCTPLLQQAVPNVSKMEAWKSKHAADAINSVALTKPFLEGNKVCTCRMVCMCVFGYMRDQEVKPLDHFDVLTELWNQAVNSALTGRHDIVQKVVASPENHPQSSVALEELKNIFPPQQFVCSGDVDSSQQGHYSHNLPCFTNVTSPLRSFISIVGQRLVTALIAEQPCPYSQEDITRIVSACNHSQQQADSYASADATVHLAAALQSRPLTLFPVVERLDGEKLRLRFPNSAYVPEEEREVELTALCPSAMQPVSYDSEQVKLSWQERIYDTAYANNSSQPASNRRDGIELCADRFVSHIPPFQWQKLLAAVREENTEKMLATVPAVQEHVHDSISDGRFALDVNSEVRRGGLIQHFAEFSLSLHTSMVAQVQVAAELKRGILTPRLQLFSLTPTLDVCVEHHTNPTQCFANLTSLPSTSGFYSDDGSYQHSWMPVLALEAAETAVNSQASAIVHNVAVVWSKEHAMGDNGDNDIFVGEFSLSESFCQERQIEFSGDSQSRHDLGVFGLEKSVPAPLDLLCVRYPGLNIPEDVSLNEQVSAMMKMGSLSVSWVGHCVVTRVEHNKMGEVSVRVRLQSSTFDPPAMLLDSHVVSQLPCTVEWIPKTPLFREMEYSVACLKSASDLARDVALGRKPVNNIDQSDVPFLVNKLSAQLNVDQKEAVQTAIKQPFTVISGPPGTGKTLTASHLACLFVERNSMTPQPASYDMARTQLLICASSDAAVDAIAAQLQTLKQANPRVVRVYGERVESLTFPVPRDTIPPNKLKAISPGKPEVQDIALHQLIRRQSNRFSQRILEYDSLFGLYPQDITDDQVEEFRSIVLQAELQELRQTEVILATCSAAASRRMAMGTNVKQIIIDSCESCMEPESLLPVILMRKAQQLVLLGDHQQTGPVVTSPTARSLGLAKSLLERYADSSVVLKEQYRMHKAITDVPSASFYSDQLKVTTKAQLGPAELDMWPGSRAQPIAFCHVAGLEETVTTVTREGVQQSVCNTKEAEAVASIVEGLVQHKGVEENSLVVISLYQAQQHLLQQHLANKNISVNVALVDQCQACEFDYVVLSTCRSVSRSQVEQKPTRDWLQRHLGVTADTHLVNMALTRARKGLVITGNKYLLQSHSMWSSLLDHYRKHKALVEASDFINALSG